MAETHSMGSEHEISPELLRNYIDNGFGSNKDEAALTLGRTTEELEGMLSGNLEIDDDLEMKMRGIANERNFEI